MNGRERPSFPFAVLGKHLKNGVLMNIGGDNEPDKY
jgi:hypothetical protein